MCFQHVASQTQTALHYTHHRTIKINCYIGIFHQELKLANTSLSTLSYLLVLKRNKKMHFLLRNLQGINSLSQKCIPFVSSVLEPLSETYLLPSKKPVVLFQIRFVIECLANHFIDIFQAIFFLFFFFPYIYNQRSQPF